MNRLLADGSIWHVVITPKCMHFFTTQTEQSFTQNILTLR